MGEAQLLGLLQTTEGQHLHMQTAAGDTLSTAGPPGQAWAHQRVHAAAASCGAHRDGGLLSELAPSLQQASVTGHMHNMRSDYTAGDDEMAVAAADDLLLTLLPPPPSLRLGPGQRPVNTSPRLHGNEPSTRLSELQPPTNYAQSYYNSLDNIAPRREEAARLGSVGSAGPSSSACAAASFLPWNSSVAVSGGPQSSSTFANPLATGVGVELPPQLMRSFGDLDPNLLALTHGYGWGGSSARPNGV